MTKPQIPSPNKRIKLAELELTEIQIELPQIPPGYDSVRVLVRHNQLPICYVNSTNINDLAQQIDILRHHPPGKASGRLDNRNSELQTAPLITVAVCTRNRADQLLETLNALLAQTYSNFEIVVIDNAPSNNSTRELCEQFAAWPGLRYICEERPGLDWARNRAIAEAQGEILAYTDDDARPDPDWLEEFARAFADPQVDALTGLVVPAELETPAQITFEDLYGGFGKGFEQKLYHKSHPTRRAFPYAAGVYGAGCNMAFRRELFERIGQFDEALDVGTATGGGGDMDIFIRVLRSGATLLYEPRVVVRHLHRRDMAALERQMGGYARAFFAYLSKWAIIDRHRALDILGYAGRAWVLWIFLKAVMSLLGRNGVPKAVAVAQFRNAPLGPLAYWQARRQVKHIREEYRFL